MGPATMLPTPLPNAMRLYTGCGSPPDSIDPNRGQKTTYAPADHPYATAKTISKPSERAGPHSAKAAAADSDVDANTRGWRTAPDPTHFLPLYYPCEQTR